MDVHIEKSFLRSKFSLATSRASYVASCSYNISLPSLSACPSIMVTNLDQEEVESM